MIEKHIMKDERDIVLTARQPKGKWVWIIFISRILFIKQQIKTGETRVNVGCREIHHVVVIPKSGQLLAGIVSAGKIGVMVVPELVRTDKVHRKAVALRRGVGIVQVGGSFRHGKTDLAAADRRQIIDHPHHDWFAIAGVVRWVGSNAVESPGSAAFVIGWLRMVLPQEFLLPDFIEFLRRKLLVTLMRTGVRRWGKRNSERLLDGRHAQRREKWS